MSIIISKQGTGATRVEKAALPHEDYLQDYVARNPQSLPMDELKDNLRLLVVGREFETDSGNIDVLAIDQDGDIYVIETKLFRNPDKRLVVAQVLDYGAALSKTYGDGGSFVQKVAARVTRTSGGSLDEQLQAYFDTSTEEATSIRETVSRNFERGNLQFVVLMDRLTERLRDLIVFLNEKSSFSIYAVEMDFYHHDGLEIIIPRLFGGETRKQGPVARVAGPRSRWDPDEFVDALATAAGADVANFLKKAIGRWEAAGRNIDWSKSTGPMFKFNDPSRQTFFTFGMLDEEGHLYSVERLFDRIAGLGLPRGIFDDYADTLVRLIPGASRTRRDTPKSPSTRERLKFEENATPLRSLMTAGDEWFAAMERAVAQIKSAPVT